jgi:hypothetical protein
VCGGGWGVKGGDVWSWSWWKGHRQSAGTSNCLKARDLLNSTAHCSRHSLRDWGGGGTGGGVPGGCEGSLAVSRHQSGGWRVRGSGGRLQIGGEALGVAQQGPLHNSSRHSLQSCVCGGGGWGKYGGGGGGVVKG